MCQKQEKKGGEEMIEKTSEKSEELEVKNQGAYKRGDYSLLRQKK